MKRPLTGWEVLAAKVNDHLGDLEKSNRLRQLCPQTPEINSPMVAGHIDLTHNDYLGLRVDPKFRQRAQQAITYLPPGAGASRLLGGEHPIFAQLEDAFSEFKQVESSLYFNSGYAANEAVATCLALDNVEFFSDELNHASIIDGQRLARLPKQKRHIYPHLDTTTLETQLAASDGEINIVFTESVFSMDGDVAPLEKLADLCKQYRGVLVVDEAHATGVYGEQGRGLIDTMLGSHDQLISINTCGKALAGQGALVCGPIWFRDLMINKARSFIYSTAPSPWNAAVLLESLALVRQMDDARLHLRGVADRLRAALTRHGVNTGQSTTHIIPLIVGSDSAAIELQRNLESRGILTKAIRPPTVAEGESRVRLSLNARLSEAHIAHVTSTLEDLIRD